jgi:CRP/FNR family transcriptional regulator, cyclic AMP receptor protein
LAGIKKLLLPRPGDAHSSDAAAILARALFGAAPKSAAEKTGGELVGFLRRVALFEDLQHGELKRLARIVHERSYGDGEYISEQGKPGAAVFLVRSGIVEITRRSRSGDEIPLATLEAPTSFEELAAMGEVVRWTSARARGPVSLVALGRSDLDALGRDFPYLANKILSKLVQVVAARVQMLVETQYFSAQDGESET